MDLNQLYHDHQLSLMRADAAHCAARGMTLRQDALQIAGRIRSIHRLAGATALRNWERSLTS